VSLGVRLSRCRAVCPPHSSRRRRYCAVPSALEFIFVQSGFELSACSSATLITRSSFRQQPDSGGHIPDDLEQAVGNNEHFAGDFALAADEVSWSEDVRTHLEHEVVQKFRLALVKYRHLLSTHINFYALTLLMFCLPAITGYAAYV